MASPAVHRIGFTQLSGASELSPSESRVNIIFVHGLRGHLRHTWEGPRLENTARNPQTKRRPFRFPFRTRSSPPASTGNESVSSSSESRLDAGVFWPHEFLVQDIPEARVWTYGYNADVIGGLFQASNQNSVSQHGQDLAVRIDREIIDEGPIVFVAHSLGGIIVKDALVKSDKCRQRTSLIVFLGTPHRGSSYASWGQILANLANVARQDSNKGLLGALETNNSVLDGPRDVRNQGFHNKVVDDVSSKIGLVGIETVETIDADHRQMARCSARSDQQYRAVFGVLGQFVRQNEKGKHQGPRPALSDVPKQGGPGTAATPTFLVPYSRNEAFIGRRSLLEILRRLPLQGESQKRLALFGLGGVGKTQLVLEYVYWLKESQPHISIFWVHASNAERFRDSFMTIAETYGIPGYDDPQADILLLVKKWLEQRGNGRWLMVVDNADEIQLFYGRPANDANGSPDGNKTNLARYIPDCSHGTILIATRDKKTGSRLTNRNRLVEVGNMGLDESEGLLRDNLQGIDLLRGTGLQELASRLENLPLALVQAASFIRENSISVPRYLALLDKGDQHFVELLSEEFEAVGRDTSTPHSITSTWILSFEQIQKQNEFAGKLLSLMSCLDRQAIPSEILQDYSVMHHAQKDPKSEIELTKALGILRSFSFITEGTDGHFTMHRLVQLVTQKWLARKKLYEYSSREALQVVNLIYPADCEDPKNWGRCNTYLAHAYAVLKAEFVASEDLEDAAVLSLRLGCFLESTGDYVEAESLYLRAVKSLKSPRQERSPLMANCVDRLSGLYGTLGRADEAEEHQMQWLEAVSDVLEQGHPGKILEKCRSAGVYHREGRLEQVDLLQTEIIGSAVMIERPPHIVDLDFLRGLAVTYIYQDRRTEAELLLLYVLTVCNTFLRKGFDASSHIIHVKSNLAIVYRFQGRLEESMDLKLEALEGMKGVYGDEHPATTIQKFNLALEYKNRNQLDMAELLLTQLVETSGRVAGQEHPDTARFSLSLAEVYFDLDQPEKAEQILIPTLKIFEATFGEEHQNTNSAVTLLGRLYIKQCKYQNAKEAWRRAWEIRRKIYGEGSDRTLRALMGLGKMHEETGRLGEAEQNYSRLWELTRNSEGEDGRKIKALRALTRIKDRVGKLEEAVLYGKQLWELMQKVLGKEHPDTLRSLHVCGRVEFKRGEFKEAAELYKEEFEIRSRVQGEENTDTLQSLGRLAGAQFESGHFEDSRSSYKRLFEVKRKLSGEQNEGTMHSAHNLALCLWGMKEYEAARAEMVDCYNRQKEVLGPSHPSTLRTLSVIDNHLSGV